MRAAVLDGEVFDRIVRQFRRHLKDRRAAPVTPGDRDKLIAELDRLATSPRWVVLPAPGRPPVM